MSVIEAIKNRNSNCFISDQPVDRKLITEILDAAVCTPVHYRTNPWRFLVIEGEGRAKLGDFMARRLAKNMAKDMDDPDSKESLACLKKMRRKAFRAPVIIVVGAARAEIPKALPVEDVATASAACQNILLAASALGLSAIWRTGAMTYEVATAEFLGFEEGTELVGFIYLGYPAKDMPPKKRETSEAYTRWMNK